MNRKTILKITALTAVLGLLAGCGGTVPPAVRPGSTVESVSGGITDAPVSDTGAADSAGTAEAVGTTGETAPVTTAPETEAVTTEAATEAVTTEAVVTEAPVTTEAPAEDPLWTKAAAMSLEDRVAQMFVVTPEALTGISGPVTLAGDTTRAAYDRIPVGGLIYMGQNLENKTQTENLCWNMQQISLDRTGLPVFLCVDEEGGTVARVSGSGKFNVPAIENMSQVTDPERAREIGSTIGGYLAELGFNVDFAPVADVLTNRDNTVVRSRSFGADPAAVTALDRALAEGLQSKGVLPCYKHFPGHGATAEDSHQGYAVSHRTREELLNAELVPFRDAAEQGIPFVMVGHISTPELTSDGLPASLSPALVTDLLRKELGYAGIIITDALGMGAIAQHYKPGEAALLAVKAGNDMLLLSDHLEESYQAVLEAVRSGEISEDRITESVCRILRAKQSLPAR